MRAHLVRQRSRGSLLLLPLLLLIPGAPVAAQEAAEAPPPAPEAEEGGAPEACSSIDLELEGASERSDEGSAAFVEEWKPSLEALAACLSQEALKRACVEVQGQYDDHTFDTAVARALGGQRPAQIHRARGRADAVIGELAELGVPYDRVHHRPPPANPTYRGVRVQILPGCVGSSSELPEWASSPEVLAESLKQVRLREERDEVAPPAPEPQAPFGPFSFEGGLGLDLLLGDPRDAIGGGLRVGAGWGEDRGYLRVFATFGTSDALEQRAWMNFGVSGGVRPLRWLRIGALLAQRYATFEPSKTWLERSLHLAVEAEERVVQFGPLSVWVGQVLSPAGWRRQRASVVNGEVFDSPDRRDYVLEASLLVMLRGHLDAGKSLRGTWRPTSSRK